jgi:xanthine dehydrogenase YagS FAD-binding subunit
LRPFAYERAADERHAVTLLERDDARFLAGGTNLVDLMKLGVEEPELLVDVRRLNRQIRRLDEGALLVGAGVTNSELAADAAVRSEWPAVAQAVLAGASGQLRNVATVGGNLLQRTRCLYFQDVTKPCNKRAPGSGCPAREGEHRNLAVLGWSEHCVATHPSDLAVALAALDAVVHVEGRAGPRTVAAADLYRLPGDRPDRDTVLEHGELIVAVELPPSPPASRSLYVKVRERASFSFALVSVAAALVLDDDGVVEDVRLAFGGLAHKPWRARRAEAALHGAAPTPDRLGAAVDAELGSARPLRDNGYKLPLARSVAVRALADLARTR